MILRPYQQEAVSAVINSSKRSIGISLPTGSGKTMVARAIYDFYFAAGHKICFVVPSIELMEQAGKAFEMRNFLGEGNEPNWGLNILISTVQSLCKRTADLEKNKFDILIVDEAHRACSPSYSDLFAMPWKLIINLSATMFRADGKRLADVVDTVVYEKDLHWAIKEKYLTPYELLRPKQAHLLPLVSEKIQTTKADGTIRITDRKSYNHHMRNDLVKGIVQEVIETRKRKACIMFVNTIEHAKEMAQVMGAGWGWCSGSYREDLEKFKKGKLTGIVSVQLLLEGFDHPPADFLIVNGGIRADSTGKIRWIQLLGRILRLSPGKEVAIALDLSSNGCPDVEYRADLEGISAEEEEAEEAEKSVEMTVLERLEHPCLLDLDTLIDGLRQVNSNYRKLQKELRTNLNLVRTGDGYVVAGSAWRITANLNGWTATDGTKTIACTSVEDLSAHIDECLHRHLQGPASVKQVSMMISWGMDINVAKSMSCQEAHDYISHRLAQKHVEPATEKQLKLLRWKMPGKVPSGLSKEQAKKLIVRCIK